MIDRRWTASGGSPGRVSYGRTRPARCRRRRVAFAPRASASARISSRFRRRSSGRARGRGRRCSTGRVAEQSTRKPPPVPRKPSTPEREALLPRLDRASMIQTPRRRRARTTSEAVSGWLATGERASAHLWRGALFLGIAVFGGSDVLAALQRHGPEEHVAGEAVAVAAALAGVAVTALQLRRLRRSSRAAPGPGGSGREARPLDLESAALAVCCLRALLAGVSRPGGERDAPPAPPG